MISVILFDVFFLVAGSWAAMRVISALRSGVAKYQTGRFSRSEKPVVFWIVVAGYVALVAGALYGIAVGAGM